MFSLSIHTKSKLRKISRKDKRKTFIEAIETISTQLIQNKYRNFKNTENLKKKPNCFLKFYCH